MLHSSSKASLLRIMTIGILSFVLLGSSVFIMAPAMAASPTVKTWAIPSISYIGDGKDQIIAIEAQLESGNFVIKIRVIVDQGTTNERSYEFRSNGTVLKPDVGFKSVECKEKRISDGYSIGKGNVKCRLHLDKTTFALGTHPVKVELVLDIGTFTDTTKFTLKGSPSGLADLVNKAFTAPSTARRGHTYTTVVTEKNEGAIGAGGHWVQVYLSGDAARDSGDKVVGQKYVSHIGKGATRVLSINVKIPNGYPLGPEVFISYVDSYDIIGESNESNNQQNKPTTITS